MAITVTLPFPLPGGLAWTTELTHQDVHSFPYHRQETPPRSYDVVFRWNVPFRGNLSTLTLTCDTVLPAWGRWPVFSLPPVYKTTLQGYRHELDRCCSDPVVIVRSTFPVVPDRAFSTGLQAWALRAREIQAHLCMYPWKAYTSLSDAPGDLWTAVRQCWMDAPATFKGPQWLETGPLLLATRAYPTPTPATTSVSLSSTRGLHAFMRTADTAFSNTDLLTPDADSIVENREPTEFRWIVCGGFPYALILNTDRPGLAADVDAGVDVFTRYLWHFEQHIRHFMGMIQDVADSPPVFVPLEKTMPWLLQIQPDVHPTIACLTYSYAKSLYQSQDPPTPVSPWPAMFTATGSAPAIHQVTAPVPLETLKDWTHHTLSMVVPPDTRYAVNDDTLPLLRLYSVWTDPNNTQDADLWSRLPPSDTISSPPLSMPMLLLIKDLNRLSSLQPGPTMTAHIYQKHSILLLRYVGAYPGPAEWATHWRLVYETLVHTYK